MSPEPEKFLPRPRGRTISSLMPPETCGLGSFRPKWLERLATPNVFMINFSLIAILQGANFTYFVGSMSTLEKRFAFESKVSGFILIADNLSQMVVNPLVGYLGTRCNRPRLIAIGELIVALSCFMSALPYFIYGPGLHFLVEDAGSGSVRSLLTNSTSYEICDGVDKETGCDQGSHSTVIPAVVILWLASFVNGIGYTAYYTIGLPYLDDNVKKKNSAMYLSYVSTIRLCGPAFGFLLSSLCLRWYEDPFYDPQIDRLDPRWIGSWWLGFLILGSSIAISSLPLFLFPKQLRRETVTAAINRRVQEPTIKVAKVQEVKAAVKRLLNNPVLVFHAVGGTFRLLGYLGYYIFQPKYMEAQFRKSASEVAFYSGTASILTMAVGIMFGGIYIRRFRPAPKKLASFMFIVEIFANMAILGAMFLGCSRQYFHKTSVTGDGSLSLDSECNRNCGCTRRVYQPSCSSDSVSTFFSPCFAGCRTVGQSSGPNANALFSDCSCVGENTLAKGYCPSECTNFPAYITILAVGNFVASMARTGNTLLTLRCVEPKDKSFALGIIGSLMAVFAFIPYPLIFGAITDSACGKTGNCWVYDVDKFRYYLHGAAFAFMMIGSLFDVGVILKADQIKNLYDDDPHPDDPQQEHQMQLNPKTEEAASRGSNEDVLFDRSFD